jgi:hypothetical protein
MLEGEDGQIFGLEVVAIWFWVPCGRFGIQ